MKLVEVTWFQDLVQYSWQYGIHVKSLKWKRIVSIEGDPHMYRSTDLLKKLPMQFHGRKELFAPSYTPCSSVGKESACNAADPGLIPGLGRSPGEGNGNPLRYSCLENPMDRRVRRATVHGVSRVRHDLATKPPPYGNNWVSIWKRKWILIPTSQYLQKLIQEG